MQAASELCEQYGALLIIDEVQTGFFRTGAPFSYQLAGIEPDIVSMAKGIGGGFPMGAVAARAQVADVFGPGDHGSTFGGNALASAVGRTVVQTLIDEKVGEHVIAVGAHLAERLSQMPHAVEVRGAGLMRGLQLDVPVATEAVNEGLRQGLVLNHIGDSILRFLPPLVVTDEQRWLISSPASSTSSPASSSPRLRYACDGGGRALAPGRGAAALLQRLRTAATPGRCSGIFEEATAPGSTFGARLLKLTHLPAASHRDSLGGAASTA